MNLLLSYYKCLDDWTDERKWKGRLRAAALRGRDKMVEARYPEKAEHIYTLLEHIPLYEKGGRCLTWIWRALVLAISPYRAKSFACREGRLGTTTCAGWDFFLGKLFLSVGCLRGDVERTKKTGRLQT